jgi:hypothetical protein
VTPLPPFRNSQVLDELMVSNQTTASLTPQFSFERDFNSDDFVSLIPITQVNNAIFRFYGGNYDIPVF